MSRLEFSEVKRIANGKWPSVLVGLGIPLEHLTGRHGQCPGCGGKDRFRFDDKNGDGTWICGGGGDVQSGDGFSLLCHVNGWTKTEALKAVAGHLGVAGTLTPAVAAKYRRKAEDAEAAKILHHEMIVLLQVVSKRMSSVSLTADGAFRASHPEWTPYPGEHWDRERLAAKRIKAAIEVIYGA